MYCRPGALTGRLFQRAASPVKNSAPVAAEVTRLILSWESGGQLEPPHVGCYFFNGPPAPPPSGNAEVVLSFPGQSKNQDRLPLHDSNERISLFEQSRSDCVMVAAGFSPRDNGRERLRVAERRLNRLSNLPFSVLPPRGLKPTAYRHGLALRGKISRTLAPKM
jgi:hypothetical protein